MAFTDNFVDISTNTTPKFITKAKIRYNDDFLFVGAWIQDTAIWANISSTCHCLNNSQDQVIFHDNDFETFVDADGSTHFYKEFEMNAANATWDLCLNKPYDDGGYENSSRVFGDAGWDMQPPLHCATHVDGTLNDPSSPHRFWSVEIAFPLSRLIYNTSATLPIKRGAFWRINFSRVEYNVAIVNNRYWKQPSCQSCPQPGTEAEDNWVWSPQGAIAMHLPEHWGMLQFSDEPVNTTRPVVNAEWPLRSVAMAVYYAEHGYAAERGNRFTDDLVELAAYTVDPTVLEGVCTHVPIVSLPESRTLFKAWVVSHDGVMAASVTDDRYLRVFYAEEVKFSVDGRVDVKALMALG